MDLTNQDLKNAWVRQLLDGMVIEVDASNGKGGFIYVDRPYVDEEHFIYHSTRGDWAGVKEPICDTASPFIHQFLEGFASIRATKQRVEPAIAGPA